MSGPLAADIRVTLSQRAVLTALVRRATCPQALALRARIILEAATGQRNEPLARKLGCAPKTDRKWRARWADAAARPLVVDDDPVALAPAIGAALADAPRSGAPGTFAAAPVVQIINLACRPPGQVGRPVTGWTPRELADEAVQ